jgi:hypothetical protein
MKHLSTVMALGLWLLIAVSGCSNSQNTNNSNSQFPPKAGTEFKHGAKLIVQYLPSKDETAIYQQDFSIKPDVMVGNASKGKHAFNINNTATFKGKALTAAPYGCSLTFIHSIPSKSGWHFPPKSKIAFVADGERVEIEKYQQMDLDKDLPTDKEFYESMITEMKCESYSKIAKAKDVEFQIGNGKFKLSDENIKAFQDFADLITPKQ